MEVKEWGIVMVSKPNFKIKNLKDNTVSKDDKGLVTLFRALNSEISDVPVISTSPFFKISWMSISSQHLFRMILMNTIKYFHPYILKQVLTRCDQTIR